MKRRKGSFVIELLFTFPFFLLVFFFTFNSIFKYGSSVKLENNLTTVIRECALRPEGSNEENTGGFDYYYETIKPLYRYSTFKICEIDGDVLFEYDSNETKPSIDEINEYWTSEYIIEIYVSDTIFSESLKIIDYIFSIKVGGQTYYLFNTQVEAKMKFNIERGGILNE